MGSPIIFFGNAAKLLKSTLTLPGSTSGSVSLQAPATPTAYTMTLPSTVAGSGQVLTDAAGNGTLSWTTVSGGASTMLAPNIQKFTSGSGTYGLSYYFTVTSANATVGATYTNNAQTFTVVNTITAGTSLLCTSTGVPSASGTLTKSAGTGDATITFSLARAPIALEIEMIGGGGGGGGSGVSGTGTAAGNGGSTTFGSQLVAGGGTGSTGAGGNCSNGGTASLGTGPQGIAIVGSQGSAATVYGTSPGGQQMTSGQGGMSPFGGVPGAPNNSTPASAQPNSGSGGSGGAAGSVANASQGGGGAAGGYIKALIPNNSSAWATTHAYAVGAAGAAGGAGASGGANAGGVGGSGVIIVTERWQ